MKRIMVVLLLMMGIIIVACKKNEPPVINSVTANPDSVTPGQATTLTVNADDPDGDVLTYTWAATSGTLSSTSGSSVTWTAPVVIGNYTITVTAEDPGGLKDEASRTIKVYQTVYGYTEGQANLVLPIYDSTWTYCTIGIAGAPAAAVIDSIHVGVDITHTYPSDLYIVLRSPDTTDLVLWDNDYPGGIAGATTTFFNGKPVNGDWTLWIFDEVPGDVGTLNSWAIGIFWHY
jgi:hypothetical protein